MERKQKLFGSLVAVEGGDGSGKATHVKRLSARLAQMGYAVQVWDFPRYTESYYGRMAGRMLAGEFGPLMSIHPNLAAVVFANDRLAARGQILEHLRRGGVAVCNRYVDSNLAHGAAKFDELPLALEYIQEIEKLEYDENRMPFPAVSLYLSTEASVSAHLVNLKGEREYLGGGGVDQAEKDLSHQERTRLMYEMLCQTRERFVRVECMKADGSGKIESIGVIEERIWEAILSRFVV